MAKDREQTVEVPVSTLDNLQARLASLEHQLQVEREVRANPPAQVIDDKYEAWKKEAGRPASERTQDVADRRFGTAAPRFRVRLDATGEDGKPGPKITEHFPLVISANSDDEAGARYLKIMGIRKHDYRLVAEPLPA